VSFTPRFKALSKRENEPGRAGIATDKSSMVVEWFMAHVTIEEPVEVRRVHNPQPSTTPFSRCLILNCMKSPQSHQS